MIRSLLRAAIANATITSNEAGEAAGLHLDALILHAAELLPFEQVEVVNLHTGDRFRTFVGEAPGGSGEARLKGGERAPVRPGERVAILAFGQLHEGQTLAHKARFVTLDDANRVIAIVER